MMKKLDNTTLKTIVGGKRWGCAASIAGGIIMGAPSGPWAAAAGAGFGYLTCPVNAR